MMMRFDDATAIASTRDGSFEVDLRPEYAIAGVRPNGGYMLACLGRAALRVAEDGGAPHQHPVAASAQFLRSPEVGPARIDTEVLRVGRSVTQVSARLLQNGATAVTAHFTLGTLPEAGEPYWGGVPVADIPPIEECRGSEGRPFHDGFELRFDPETSFELTPDGPLATGDGELRAWLIPPDGEVMSPVMLLFVADSLPPPTFSVVSTGWVPTLDLSVYIRAQVAPGPLRMRFRAQMIQDGYADEVFEAWDSTDRLILQSTQLTALRLPAT